MITAQNPKVRINQPFLQLPDFGGLPRGFDLHFRVDDGHEPADRFRAVVPFLIDREPSVRFQLRVADRFGIHSRDFAYASQRQRPDQLRPNPAHAEDGHVRFPDPLLIFQTAPRHPWSEVLAWCLGRSHEVRQEGNLRLIPLHFGRWEWPIICNGCSFQCTRLQEILQSLLDGILAKSFQFTYQISDRSLAVHERQQTREQLTGTAT